MLSETKQWFVLGLFVAVLAVFVTLVIGSDIKRVWLRILVGTVSSAAFIYLALWAVPHIGWLIDIVELPVLLSFLAISLGVAAHKFKTMNKLRLRYGQVEVFVGALTAVAVSYTANASLLPKLTALAGAIYIVARGLNNWDEHLQAHPDKLGNNSFFQLLRTRTFKEDTETDK